MQVAFKAKGTQLLKAQKYTDAIDKYTEALNIMNQKINRNQVKTQQQMFELIESIKLPCLKNICLCYMKLKQYADCIITCDLILEIDSECQKTFYRKAYCLIELEQFRDADAALVHAETINSLSKQIKQLRQKFIERKDRMIERRDETRRQQQHQSTSKSTGLIARIINFILYWVMLPLRWLQYSVSFGKKTVKNGYESFVVMFCTNLLSSVSNLVATIFSKIKSTIRFLKQSIVQKVNSLVKTFIGPFNSITFRYLSINIPFYKWLSGESSLKVNSPIETRYETE